MGQVSDQFASIYSKPEVQVAQKCLAAHSKVNNMEQGKKLMGQDNKVVHGRLRGNNADFCE